MATPFSRAIVIVLDSVGIGELPDASAYGDQGSNTLGNIARRLPLAVPTLRSLGLDRLVDLDGGGHMGSAYARLAFGIAAPRVGLLSIGEEASKGNELTREAHRLLKTSSVSFIGNVEARDVYSGKADVIVCDGFTGNIALKVSEGLVEVLADFLSEEFRRRVDYSEYGGAPLLGVAGVAVVGHGRSSAKAVRNGIALAHRFASERFVARVEQDIAAAAITHS